MLHVVGGGTLPYMAYSWSDTDNEFTYSIEALCNGGRAIYNGCAWLYNKL